MPEVYNSIYDIRQLLKSTAILRDGRPISVPKRLRKYIERNELGRLLAQYGVIGREDEVPPPAEAVSAKGS